MQKSGHRKRPIDRIDLKILKTLQRHARITHTALANEVGLSVTPCKERVKRLRPRASLRVTAPKLIRSPRARSSGIRGNHPHPYFDRYF